MENWKFINANYEVSDKGNIKSVNYRGTGIMVKTKHISFID